jgi:hypothetical protein
MTDRATVRLFVPCRARALARREARCQQAAAPDGLNLHPSRPVQPERSGRLAGSGWHSDLASYHVLTTVDLPDNDATAKQILRRLEAAFIESALARKEPLLNKNEPVCQCQKTREYQRHWRERHPNYMAQKSAEWRQRRKALMAAQSR